jgi:serine/threonine protein kinase
MKKSKLLKKLKKLYSGDTDNNTILNTRYTLNKVLGTGGLCKVFEAKDLYCEYFKDEQTFAIKLPLSNLLKKKDISAFLYAEYSFLRQLNHKNIVQVYNFGIDDITNVPYIVLEYLKGDLLYDLPIYKMHKSILKRMFFDMLSALDFIHSKNIIHADITPNNIMISNNNEVKLFDFGIARYKESNGNISIDYNKLKAYNPMYSSPKVLNKEKPSFSSDKFSLACVFYEMFTGELPFKESSKELITLPLTFFNISKKIPFSLRSKFVKLLNTY